MCVSFSPQTQSTQRIIFFCFPLRLARLARRPLASPQAIAGRACAARDGGQGAESKKNPSLWEIE
jgi:hypothetical protein